MELVAFEGHFRSAFLIAEESGDGRRNRSTAREIDVGVMYEFLKMARSLRSEKEKIIELLSVPKDVASNGLTAAVYMGLPDRSQADININMNEHSDAFEKLCAAAPAFSHECLEFLALASFSIDTFLVAEEFTIESGLTSIVNCAQTLGCAIALLPKSLGYISSKVHAGRTSMLRKAGEEGAKVKNGPFKEMKNWALQEASEMRGDDKAISRKLAGRLPKEFLKVSREPQRFIYDALRDAKKR